jgi:hypothetical protein
MFRVHVCRRVPGEVAGTIARRQVFELRAEANAPRLEVY